MIHDQEFELVTQALWTDPADQSGWLYHRWLIGDGTCDEPSQQQTGASSAHQICSYPHLPGQDEEVLVREIDQIEQLVEAEPEAKCKPPIDTLVYLCVPLIHKSPHSFVSFYTGPLESLVHYSTLRLQHSLEVSTRARIKSQAIDRLVILERIDPPRRQRYLELRNQFAE